MRKNRRRTRGMILACFLALLGLGTTAAWFFLPPLTLRVAIGPMGSDNQKLLAAFVRGWEDVHPRVRMKLVSTTDAVTWRLVSRSSLPNYAAGELARLLCITRSKLVTMFPQAGSIEAPDTDKSGALPVHPGAAAYFNGEQTSVLERFTDVLYVGAIIVSLVGAVCAWIMTAWRGSGPHQEREHLQRLMTIFWEALAVGQDAIDIFDKEVDEMVSPGRWSALRMGRCRLRSSRCFLSSSHRCGRASRGVARGGVEVKDLPLHSGASGIFRKTGIAAAIA